MGLECAWQLTSMVDVVVMVDRVEATATAAASDLAAAAGAATEPFVADVTDRDALARLADRVAALGTLRAVAHAAGISPTMADWRAIFDVDLVGTALVAEAMRPLSTDRTATVCFASMAPLLGDTTTNPAADAALDEPLDEHLLERMREAVGPAIENTGIAYGWAKRGVHRFVHQEAVRLGPLGARICSVSPGLIDTPQQQQEMEVAPEHRPAARADARSGGSGELRRWRPWSPSSCPTRPASSTVSTCWWTAGCTPRCSSARGELDVQPAESAQDVGRHVPVAAGVGRSVLLLDDADVTHAVEDSLDADAAFGTGQWRTRADVDAMPERDVVAGVRAIPGSSRPDRRTCGGPGSPRR